MSQNSRFDLVVDFSGLFLFAKRKPESETGEDFVSVLLPDGRNPDVFPKKLMVMTSQGRVDVIDEGRDHVDGTPAEPHAGYLSIPLEHLVNDPPAKGEVVIRLDRSEVRFGWPSGSVPSAVDFNGLVDVANFLEIAPRLEIHDAHTHKGQGGPPPKALLARLKADRGTFATAPNRSGSGWGFSGHLRKDGKAVHKPPRVARVVRWTVDNLSASGLSLTVQSLDDDSEKKTLGPLLPRNGRISLKLGNLCCDNPLEWEEFGDADSDGDEDHDFRWLYNLMEPATLSNMLKDLEGYRVPVPTLTQGAFGETSKCIPGTGGP